MIEFHTLGELSLTAPDGRELQSILAQPKRAALLAYLVSPSTPDFVPRDTLLLLFWPERDDEHARSSLRSSLYFLRRSLGPEVLVSRTEQDVGVIPDRLRCDAALFRGRSRRGRGGTGPRTLPGRVSGGIGPG